MKVALEPAILSIFGITGDLASRKLLPALYHLAHDELLPESFKIVGITRKGTTPKAVVDSIRQAVESQGDTCAQETLDWLEAATSIITMDITDPAEYIRLKKELDRLEDELGVCLNRLFYLAIPSQIYLPVVRELGRSELNYGCQHGRAESRLLVEKPFGYDLASAQELISETAQSFNEDQIYRIDHYLAKETVQNILTFRFQNPLFRSVWDGQHVSHIVITAAESIGIEGRIVFYEQMGALRDLIQSHLLQLLSLATMEQPEDFSAASIHAAKLKLLNQVKPPHDDQMVQYTVRGQYADYRNEVSNNDSAVETFAAVQLAINSPAWQGIPILIRTGKSLARKVTEVTLFFKQADETQASNRLTIRIQPNEGIVLGLKVKKPGFKQEIEDVQMDFYYGQKLRATHPDAYERVIVDVMRGDKTLFATGEEVLASWRIVEPILRAWQRDATELISYKAGSWGPEQADKLAAAVGTHLMSET